MVPGLIDYFSPCCHMLVKQLEPTKESIEVQQHVYVCRGCRNPCLIRNYGEYTFKILPGKQINTANALAVWNPTDGS